MKNLKTLALTTLTLAATVVAPVAKAANWDHNNLDAHFDLLRTVEKTGVQVFINDEYCNTGDFDGVYSSQGGALLICQDNAKVYNGRQVTWTANDLDTIRHEVHHLIQDCSAGGRGNGRLDTVYGEPERLADEILGVQRKNAIKSSYASNGANAHTLQLEIEAFSVAADVTVEIITSDLKNYCL
jgi:hypothetical protein